MADMERRIGLSGLEVREAEDGGAKLEGYAAVFRSLSENLGGFREQIEPGAFGDDLGDVRALWNHNSDLVIGRTSAGTLRCEEDEYGLRVEIHPPDWASSYVESVQRGDVNQMSFGFSVRDDRFDEDDDGQIIRTLKDVRLFEVSPVAFPAYPATSIDARAMEQVRQMQARAHQATKRRARMRRRWLDRMCET